MKNKITAVRRITGNERGEPLDWLNLFEVEYQSEHGKLGKWSFASREREPVLGPAPLNVGAVVIVPMLRTGDGLRLVVVREFRIPLGDYEYGFPAGLCEDGESPAETAARELHEETGLTVTKILRISPAVVSSAGMSDEAVQILFVECEGTPCTDHSEGTEDIEIRLLDREGALRLAQSNEKQSGKAWPILLMFGLCGFEIEGLENEGL